MKPLSVRAGAMKNTWTAISGILLFLWGCEQHTLRRADYQVHGIDVSHYQSVIHWDTVAAQRIHFAFVKATEGATMNDSMFCYNWAEMKRTGIKRGAYHFYRPKTSALAQADNFSRLVEMEQGDLPPVLDVEVLDGVSKTILINGIRTWLYQIEIRYNVKPIIYTSLKFYNKVLAGHFDEYPIWIARYNFREPTLACGRTWHFWQYGNQGRIKGIRGNVDFNVFNGSLSDLELLCLTAPDNNVILSSK
jgi:lysozyme